MAPGDDGTANLRKYILAKQHVTACARALRQLLERHSTPVGSVGSAGAEQARSLLVKLAKDKERYSRSEGLCLPHLRAALAAVQDRDVAQFLLQEQVRRLQEISEDMRSYALKRDALRRQLLNTQEENAWRRALVQLVGEQTARITSERKA